ncbi:LAQU0S04e02190g1_1 [Lachancea quebecensis]|uniref:Vacuolar protein sorting-associated protein 17 n=1 Tax=Lachancea quebecensis TaxID=1654605 RepID=A0A0P1KQA0_9SACH|nr:LAQU0S04e02190g1_1 [Lachancea quebecensis]
MSSAVAYDPYDDIDNNPFSEPEANPQHSASPDAPAPDDAHPSTEAQEAIKDDSNSHAGVVTEHEQGPPAQKRGDSTGNFPEGSTPAAAAEDTEALLPERKSSRFQLVIKVTGLERVGSFTNKKENPTVKFDVSTNLPTFRKQQHRSLKKTFTEFRNLRKFLYGSIVGTFVPALPPPSTSYGISNSEDYSKTVSNIQEWFDRIAADPFILRSEELAFFIESDFDTYTPVGKTKPPLSGLKRKTLKQLAPPFDECLELAEFRPLVKSVHHLSQDIQTKMLKLCKLRKSLSHDENSIGQGFKELCIDQSQAHSKFYNKFGKTLSAVGDIDSVMATLDIATLYDGLEWLVQETYSVKEALTNRHFLMRDLLQAQQTSSSRQEQARKLRARRDVSPLKVDEAIRALKAATTTEHTLTLKLRRVTANMLLEKQRWLEWCDQQLQTSIKEYTLRKIEYERKKLSLLERIRADVRAADDTGGLSRLGRGTRMSTSGVSPSQTAQGDSWTSDPRSRAFEPSVLRTEFDASLESDSRNIRGTLPEDQHALDARSAASLLGTSSF